MIQPGRTHLLNFFYYNEASLAKFIIATKLVLKIGFEIGIITTTFVNNSTDIIDILINTN